MRKWNWTGSLVTGWTMMAGSLAWASPPVNPSVPCETCMATKLAHTPTYHHIHEGAPKLKFKTGYPRPVCDPNLLPHFGYFQTCWSPWPFPADWGHCPTPTNSQIQSLLPDRPYNGMRLPARVLPPEILPMKNVPPRPPEGFPAKPLLPSNPMETVPAKPMVPANPMVPFKPTTLPMAPLPEKQPEKQPSAELITPKRNADEVPRPNAGEPLPILRVSSVPR